MICYQVSCSVTLHRDSGDVPSIQDLHVGANDFDTAVIAAREESARLAMLEWQMTDPEAVISVTVRSIQELYSVVVAE